MSQLAPRQAAPRWSERVWMILIAALLLNSILRGVRAPGSWSYTHLLLNYDFGFSKRALQGAIIAALDIPGLYDYSFCFWYATAILTANILLLLWILRRLCATADMTARLTALVFASSLAVVVLAHTIGYGDQVALLVTLLALATRNFYHRCILVAVLFSASILVHETEFVIFFPVILFRFLIDLDTPIERRKLLALCFACACVVATLLVVGNTHLSEASASAMYQVIQSQAQYSLREDQLDMLTMTFGDWLSHTPDAYRTPSFQRFFLSTWLVTLPTTAYLVHRSWLTLASSGYSAHVRAAALIASLSPLAMPIIGFDMNRWTTLATTTSFLVFSIVTLHGSASSAKVPASHGGLLVPTALIAMNLGSSIPLFDGYVVRNFPYEELLYDLSRTVIGDEPFPPPPEQCLGEGGCMTVIEPLRPPRSAVSKTEVCQ